MPVVQINMLAGRSPEVRQQLAARVTEAICSTLQAPPETVRVLITEISPENWSIGGVSKSSTGTET